MKRSVKITSLVVVLMLGSFRPSFAKEESPPDLSKDMMSRLFPKGGKRKYLTGTNDGKKIKHLPPLPIHSGFDFDDYFGEPFSFLSGDIVKILNLIKSSKDKYATQLVLRTFSPSIEKHWSALEGLSENLRDPNPLEDDYFVAKLLFVGVLKEIGESKDKALFQDILKKSCPLIERLIQDVRALAKKAEDISIDRDPQVARMLSNALPQDSLESLKVSEEKECE